jgi:4-alpha-glucanotransferase
VHAELAELAAAYGVAIRYENADQQMVDVDDDVVVAVLAQFDVAAGSPESITRELAAARARSRTQPTIVLREGTTRDVGRATVVLEDGTRREVDGELPALPLGWHTLCTSERDVTLVVVPNRLADVRPAWGWMLQLYALRSADSWGMGDFGDLATVARRSATELGAGVLLVNPVQAIGPTRPVERSPYSPTSRRFVNPLYLRVTATDEFATASGRTRAAVEALRPDDRDLIDYDEVWDAKQAALALLWSHEQVDLAADLRAFATFSAIAERHGPDWRTWPEELRDPATAHADEDRVQFHAWLQELCRAQLAEARQPGLAILHDLPVGALPGGADTWASRDAYASDVTIGAPPDAFSQLGQDWRLPPWRPDRLAELGYAPFRDMVRAILRHADGIRVDHVAGLWRLWWIPPGEPPARGTYVHYDPEAMLGILALEARRAGAIVVGEDLGTVRPEVTETLHERGMLSSAVLWFQRDWDAPGQPFTAPQDWNAHALASISTHDLPTIAGWLTAANVRLRADLGLLERSPEPEFARARADRAALLTLLREQGVPTDDLVVALHTLLASSSARLLLTSPADAVGEARQPNLPGTVDQYPNWRIPLPVTLERFLADDRTHQVVAPLRNARPTAGDPTHGAD